jgi:glucosamine--fructose-6-phosphate aminotransferase (isomerizing)
VTNTVGSAITREADRVLFLRAGPEMAVAASKTFVTQVTTLVVLAAAIARSRGSLSDTAEQELGAALRALPDAAARTLELAAGSADLARRYVNSRGFMFVGRGFTYPAALEGALKLKEVSYVHAEGYAAGELKHGPIALIDEKMPVIVIAPHDRVFEKTLSNIQEVAARGGKIILLTDPKGAHEAQVEHLSKLVLPEMPATVTPLVYAIPVQLIAYHTAVVMGTDVDQPRNLAKSVTVE